MLCQNGMSCGAAKEKTLEFRGFPQAAHQGWHGTDVAPLRWRARRPHRPCVSAAILPRPLTGTIVKIFGRYIAPPFLWLAALDAGIFYLMLRALSLGRHCRGCYFGTVVTLNTFEIILLTSTFLLITTSVGLYNRDALLDFRVFMKRFLIGWQLIFIPTVIFVAIS
jgi:hypothetical protein